MAFNRKVYVYEELFKFFGDETIITDFLKAYYKLYSILINNFEKNEILLNKLYILFSEADDFLRKININNEKIEIRIYDYDEIIELDDELLFFFGLDEGVNNLTKMPNFSYFVNVFLYLLIKRINIIFGVNNYDDFEKKWKEFILQICNLDIETKCVYLSNKSFENFIPRLYHLFF